MLYAKFAALGFILVALLATFLWWLRLPPAPLDRAQAQTLYAEPLNPPDGPISVYHLGHSLVGKTVPEMVRQLAPQGHSYKSQLGWGASLKGHWQHPNPPLNGFDAENSPRHHRDPREALSSGDYDAVIFTEMVELRDAIKWHDSPEHLAKWLTKAQEGREGVRLYLYETWHQLDDPAGWLERIDADLASLWEGKVLYGALSRMKTPQAVYLIPGGQVMAALVRRIEAGEGAPGLMTREDLFRDTIHFNDQGAYLMALTHYAVLYQRDPKGLSHQLTHLDGSPAHIPHPKAAQLMQETVWQVVCSLPATGISKC